MSLGDIDPYRWGQLCRHLEAEMERRRDLDPSTRKQVERALSVMLHSEPPRPWEGQHAPVCSLCGHDRALRQYIRGTVGPRREVTFSAVYWGAQGAKPEPSDALVCWSCLYDEVHLLESSLDVARRLLASSAGGAEHTPVFEKVYGQRLIRSVSGGECALCQRRGPALKGPPGVVLCLVCWSGAQGVHRAEQRAMEERRKLREERFDREVAEYLAEMWLVAREDAAGAMTALERRGELSPPPAPPDRTAPGAPPPPASGSGGPESAPVHLPPELLPLGAVIARSVVDKIKQAPLASAAAAWWRSVRPKHVSLGWSLMEKDDREREAALQNTGSGDAGGTPASPDAPGRSGSADDRWSAGKTRRRPPIPPARGPRDEAARWAIEFLDDEVERAIRHQKGSGDLMGDRRRIDRAYRALDEKALSRPMLERFLQSISMLRQVIDLGIFFHDYTGDELIHEEISDYEDLASRISIGVHEHVATAMAGGLIVSGGTAEDRRRVAGAIRRIVVTRTRSPFPSYGSTPFRYVEAEALYSMSEESQAEVRRQMLITPPTTMVFGTDDLDRFIEETPRRVPVRIVTYLFMNGQQHLCLDDGRVHVGPPPPERRAPSE